MILLRSQRFGSPMRVAVDAGLRYNGKRHGNGGYASSRGSVWNGLVPWEWS